MFDRTVHACNFYQGTGPTSVPHRPYIGMCRSVYIIATRGGKEVRYPPPSGDFRISHALTRPRHGARLLRWCSGPISAQALLHAQGRFSARLRFDRSGPSADATEKLAYGDFVVIPCSGNNDMSLDVNYKCDIAVCSRGCSVRATNFATLRAICDMSTHREPI